MLNLQQGDVKIQQVVGVPGKATLLPRSTRIILAEGEATGHAHVVVDTYRDVDVYQLADEFFLKVEKPVCVVHDEHDSFEIPVGIWRVFRVREYDHFAEEARVVVD